MTASAIALKKMIHFRILIPSQNLRGYMRHFQSTRQNLEQAGFASASAAGKLPLLPRKPP
jgi:hypothetical protein